MELDRTVECWAIDDASSNGGYRPRAKGTGPDIDPSAGGYLSRLGLAMETKGKQGRKNSPSSVRWRCKGMLDLASLDELPYRGQPGSVTGEKLANASCGLRDVRSMRLEILELLARL